MIASAAYRWSALTCSGESCGAEAPAGSDYPRCRKHSCTAQPWDCRVTPEAAAPASLLLGVESDSVASPGGPR